MIFKDIDRLVSYGLKTGLIEEEDRIYTVNRLLELLGLEDYEPTGAQAEVSELEDILKNLLDYACEKGIVPENSVVYRDLFDTKLMSVMISKPSEVTRKFFDIYEKSPVEATDYYYKLSCDSDYIRRYRIVWDM